MNEESVNQCGTASIVVVRTNANGRKVIQKKQKLKILRNILGMNAKIGAPFNRLLCLEARFHGLTKEELSEQLYEVCETLKGEDSNIFGKSLENLIKELLPDSISQNIKLTPNNGCNSQLKKSSQGNKVASPVKSLMDSNSSSSRSHDGRNSMSSLSASTKNGGKKRKAKEHRKKAKEEGFKRKRVRENSTSNEMTSNSPCQELMEDAKRSGSTASLKDLIKSDSQRPHSNMDTERKEMGDVVMADQTSKSANLLFGQDVLIPKKDTANGNSQFKAQDLEKKLQAKEEQLTALTEDNSEKQKEISRLKYFIERMEKDREALEKALEESEAKRKKGQQVLAKYLIKLQEKHNKERKEMIAKSSVRIGQMIHKRVGDNFRQVWEDGDEVTKLKTKLQEIVKEKEVWRKIKRSKKCRKIMEKASSNVEKEAFEEADKLFDLDNCLQVSESLCSIEENEQKEFLTFKISMKEKEELKIKEKLEQLKKEKTKLASETKRQSEELNSTLCGKKAEKKFKILDDKYLVLSLLGKGGYSEVYKAYDLENCKEVACKIHRFDDTWSRSMQANYIKHALRENETHQGLSHPRIVKHYDTIEMDDNSFCTVLELCTGPDLSEYLKINDCIPEKEAKLIISQILSGLQYLNDENRKIIHYDLKPQNILFNDGEIKISDFGLCKVVEGNSERVELTSQGVGTYWYQPPECFEMGPNPPLICSKVDVWSLGVIFYEMLYGIRPFGHDMTQQRILESRAILKTGKSVKFPVKPNVSEEGKDFIRKCLSYYYNDRYSVEEAYNSTYLRPKK